ncbi:MAG TPA: FG-GAP-like repeat-containing protein, partial [Candidatus Polarisedimenticolia bacterium]|nr:FG-GAP-like repeat-containing protein [Candidatus Polarisedimenticolia bacterium]
IAAEQAVPFADAYRENNLGVALMAHHEFDRALGKFQTACVMNPQSDTGCLNMGIALMQMQHYDDAEKVLVKSAERNPRSSRAWFNLGLLERTLGRADAALQDFQNVAALDPDDADAHYFIGLLYSEQKQYAKAIAEFRKTVETDPFHVSAEFGLAHAEGQTGDVHGALEHLNRAQHVTDQHLGKPMGSGYGQQGRYALAEEMIAPPSPAAPAVPVRFVDVTRISGLAGERSAANDKRARLSQRNGLRKGSGDARGKEPVAVAESDPQEAHALADFLGSGACVFDYDGDSRPDIFLADADGRGDAALYRNAGHGKFENVTKAAKLDFRGRGLGCAVGDYDNDGHPDLAVSFDDGVALLHNGGKGTFEDVTDAAGVRTGGLVLGVTFIDYDHDGDLDLYVTRFNDFPLDDPAQPFQFPEVEVGPGNILWRNKGDGTFMDWTKNLRLGGAAPSVGAITTDLNYEAARVPGIDLVVAAWEKFPAIFLNTREGAFRVTTPWSGDMPGPTAGVTALDFDQDGRIDLAFTHWVPPGLSVWRNVGGKSFERVPLTDPGWMRGWGIAALDYDNDGREDLVAVGENFSDEGRIILLRNEGTAGFRDVTNETGLDKIALRNPRSVVAFDYDGNGSTDLLITQNHLPPVLLENVGGNKNDWLQLAFRGGTDNKLGIGNRIEIFSGAQKQVFEISGASGYLGQGPPEILAGLGTAGEADVVRVLWPSGVVQEGMEIQGGKRTTIIEGENEISGR